MWESPRGVRLPVAMLRPAVLLLLLLTRGMEAFRVCAFNTQRLTLVKVAQVEVMDTLVRIVARCDIMVLQEVVDPSDRAVALLLRELNRSHRTQVLDSYVYHDQDDLFAREPFVAHFSLPSKVLPSLVLVPLHSTPKDVEKELTALYDVFLDASQHWQSKDVILLGDFNADCASLAKKRLSKLLLRTEPGFRWVIADGEDTTVRASTHCTYDRIILHGERCQNLVQSAAAFDFATNFQLTEEEALKISDHYPVEVELNQAARSIQPLSLAALLLSLLPPELARVA
ncbi:deoxyribonuclease-1-like 1 isoform X4 [Ochotona curzoniae]|uniref:deoxyribonuclease-1-like 1 isoform X4 n=1 Tax=Ochotona curzoniae TaxID=130825 RepID=UPI001B353E53|nr:deoxyribonuclease-1-like 1 isoform X4 [Ochotona curzoniae]